MMIAVRNTKPLIMRTGAYYDNARCRQVTRMSGTQTVIHEYRCLKKILQEETEKYFRENVQCVLTG